MRVQVYTENAQIKDFLCVWVLTQTHNVGGNVRAILQSPPAYV